MYVKKCWSLFVLLGFILPWAMACDNLAGQTPVPTETAVSQNAPTQTATDEPPTATAVLATPTAELSPTEAEPTAEPLFPTPVVTATPTATPTPEMVAYDILISEPAAAGTLLAGRETTFRGEVRPPTAEPLTLTVRIGSFTAVSAQINPDAATGSWELSAVPAGSVSGPGLLTATLGELAQTQQPVQLAFDRTGDDPYIALSQPVEGDTAVAGHAFFFQGDSQNLIDDAFTIGVLVEDCTNFIAAQRISLSSGRWYGFVILPQNAAPGTACAVAYTGEYGEGGWREALIPIQLRAYDDPQVSLLMLGNPDGPTFTAGSPTSLFGLAVNVPERAVDIELVLDSTSGSRLVATGRAFADQFGLWSIDLEIPDDAPTGPGLLTISSGADESYREIRQFVTISP